MVCSFQGTKAHDDYIMHAPPWQTGRTIQQADKREHVEGEYTQPPTPERVGGHMAEGYRVTSAWSTSTIFSIP